MLHGVCEFLWLKRLLTKLGVPISHPMSLDCDKKATISMAHNLVQHDMTKHN